MASGLESGLEHLDVDIDSCQLNLLEFLPESLTYLHVTVTSEHWMNDYQSATWFGTFARNRNRPIMGHVMLSPCLKKLPPVPQCRA